MKLGHSLSKLALVFVIVAGLGQSRAFAQSNDGSLPSDEVSMFVGSHLPSQIANVTEILPVFGARYGIGTRRFGIVEVGASNSHAYGVDFTNFDFSLRGNVPWDQGLVGIFYAGGDINYYRPENAVKRKIEPGWHVGTGAMLMASNNLWFRGDIKFMGGPGVSLFVNLGLVFQLSESR